MEIINTYKKQNFLDLLVDFLSLFPEVNKVDEQLLIIIEQLIYLLLWHLPLIVRAAILISGLFRNNC